MTQHNLEDIRKMLRAVPDFPKKGIIFQDMFPIFRNPSALRTVVDHFKERLLSHGVIDVIVGLDSRGFLLGPWLAAEIGAAFVPVRKAGKLPPPTHKVSYALEYGSDAFEISTDGIQSGQRVAVIDDLIATGGSASAAGQLVAQCGGLVVEYLFLIELEGLAGGDKLDAPCFSLFKF
jgi:adenine phosphoribosyltransferase